MAEETDILVVGAGLSGINAAYRIQTQLPHHRYTILEARDRLGGTWTFWQYPGVRTDSAMGLFGMAWHPWPHDHNMAAAPQIAAYLADAAAAQGIDAHVRLRHRVVRSEWESDVQRWTLSVDVTDEDGVVRRKEFRARWVVQCGGYYNYKTPLPALIPGLEQFKGEVVHPQFWNDKVQFADKRVVVIGSGATAVTLLPALAKTAKHVTMLQRSPSYVASLPGRDRIGIFLRALLPLSWAMTLNWWKNMAVETLFVFFVRTFPRVANKVIIKGMEKQLPADMDVKKHFTPRYNVFDQRLCFCPDGDFFRALHQPNAEIVTDTIETVTEKGIQTSSGQFIEADMIVTATGLLMSVLDSTPNFVDGTPVHETVNQRYTWHGTMLEGVPNSGAVMGYTAGTWTPGADVKTRLLIKVIKEAEKRGAGAVAPYIPPEDRKSMPRKPVLTNSSTYIVNALDRFPVVADMGPWRNGSRWISDVLRLYLGNVAEGLKFEMPSKKTL